MFGILRARFALFYEDNSPESITSEDEEEILYSDINRLLDSNILIPNKVHRYYTFIIAEVINRRKKRNIKNHIGHYVDVWNNSLFIGYLRFS